MATQNVLGSYVVFDPTGRDMRSCLVVGRVDAVSWDDSDDGSSDGSPRPLLSVVVNGADTYAVSHVFYVIPQEGESVTYTDAQVSAAAAAVETAGQDFRFGKPDERDMVRTVLLAAGLPVVYNGDAWLERVADELSHGMELENVDASVDSAWTLAAFVLSRHPNYAKVSRHPNYAKGN
jgi:hypothetical protein